MPTVVRRCGKPPIASRETEPWSSHITELAALSNCSVKLSGLVTEANPDWTPEDLAPYSSHLLETFGPDRMMFGSDWPVCLLAATYDEVLLAAEDLTSQLSADEQAEIFGGTAERCYGLK